MMIKALKNAVLAAIYIVLIASLMYYGQPFVGKDDSVIMPIAMLSLFTLSAAVMGYFFLYQPIQLYFSNDKKGAFKLFVQTVGIFAIITVILFAIMFIAF
jgi:hypothetical protein